MKYLMFLLIMFTTPLVLGAQSVTGFLTKTGEKYYLTPTKSSNRYVVLPESSDVISSLERLNSGDHITGHGTLDTTNKKIRLVSVDYVGLRKILGPWVGNEGILTFKNFSTMKFSPRLSSRSNSESSRRAYQKEFRYTLSPSEGDEWALFLSDEKTTTFATVEFGPRRIVLKIYESDSGRIVRTLMLERP